MHKAILMIRNLAIGVGLLATAGVAMAQPINLQPFTGFTFNNPIGIDFHEPANQLIMSVNYITGNPNNLDLVASGGAGTPFANAPLTGPAMVNLRDELKIATVRGNTGCTGGFNAGEVFTANGVAGQVMRINATGTDVNSGAAFWVQLATTDKLRGSFFQDRFCAAGGDLIVVTGNDQPNASEGKVFRVTSGGVATLVGTTNTHLEGVTTVANIPAVYGPAAGRILAGAEDLLTDTGTYGSNGRIYAFNPNPPFDFFTIGAGAGPTCVTTAPLVNGCNFPTATAFHPEDLDVIRKNADFFGVDFGGGKVLTAKFDDPNFPNFRDRCGQVLITQEFLVPGTSGLYALRWDGTAFVVDLLTSVGQTVGHWEHVTFTSGSDCNTTIDIVKTPDSHTFNIGDTLEWNIVVSNTGPLTAVDVKLDDPLPTTGGLTWSVFSVSAGTCNAIPASQILHCDLGDIAPAASVTVVVRSSNVGGAPAASCTQIDNTGTASASNALPKSDAGHQTCTPPPPQLRVVKSPKAGTFTPGGQTSYTIVVSNPASAGSSSATNVTLTDQLPGNGGLIWSNVSINPAQGSCTIVSNLLSCNLGTIAAGGSVTVTVTSAATTPAAACQDQPNDGTLGATNLAKATADGSLSAQDIGKLTCTPPPPGGLIAPTETTCQQFASGTASTLGQVNYSVSNGKIAQSINPGVFFYYAKITTTVANTVVTVSESQNDAGALFQIQKDQARLYKGDCSSWTGGTLINGDTGASFTIATPGTYIISIKYSTKSIAGTSAPTSDPVSYTFTATPPGASSSATVLLKKQ
jgi:uncharacterized repeat protein (TIGR01451 family)